MPDNEMQNDLRAQWQNQPGAGEKMSPEDIRIEAQRLQDRVRKRAIREYFASVITMLILLAELRFIPFPRPIRVALLMFIAGLFVFIYQLRKRSSPRALPENLGEPCLDFLRRRLEYERDALQSVWWWGILMPFGPAALVVIVSAAFLSPFLPRGLIMALIATALFAAWFTFFARLNRRAARRVQRKIDELGS